MKWLLLSCILIIFLFTFIHADTKESDDDYCYGQHMDRLRIRQNCVAKVLNQTELEIEIRSTVLNYTGDNAAIRSLTDKYCPRMQEALECSHDYENMEERCFFFLSPATALKRYNLAKVFLNYICKNSGANFLQFLELNGVSTFYNSGTIENCLSFINIWGSNSEMCDGLDKLFDCYVLSVETHASKIKLVAMSNEFRANMGHALNCTTPN